MPKILHTADLRLGAKYLGLGKAGDKVRAQLKRAWTAIIETALAEKVDAVIVAGGLFDSSEVSRPAVEFVLKEIARLEKVPVILVPGMRDHLGKGSLYYHFDLIDRPENMHPVTAENETLEFKNLDLTVIANPASGPKSKESLLEGVKAAKTGHTVVAASGIWEGINFPITESHIGKTGATYAALGGLPVFKSGNAKNTAYAFSGPPEAQDFNTTESAGVVLVDLEKNPLEITFLPLGVLVWKEVAVSNTENLPDLLEKEKGENRLLRIKLAGEKNADWLEAEDVIEGYKDQFLYLTVVDERKKTQPSKKYPRQTVAGQFVYLAEEQAKKAGAEEKALLEEALSLGLSLAAGAAEARK
ncbi:MAG TPA: metallophosphoesterase [Verrucomicrobiae bacterium]|nr:metallophosphoesterase [Verrucomicrobiae bacterium]